MGGCRSIGGAAHGGMFWRMGIPHAVGRTHATVVGKGECAAVAYKWGDEGKLGVIANQAVNLGVVTVAVYVFGPSKAKSS